MEEINNVTLISDIELAFLKGNLFRDLYDKYKFEVTKVDTSNDYENSIYLLQVYTFISLELTLYLSNHKDDSKMQDLLIKINNERLKIEEFTELKYGALSSYSTYNGFFNMKMPFGDNYVDL